MLELARMEGLTGPIEDYMPEAGQDFRALRLAQGRMRALLAEGAADQCLSLARKWLHLLRECDLPRPEIQFRILAALAYLALEDTPAAQRELRDAIRLGARHNIVRDFLDEPKALRAAVARTCSAMEVTDPEFQTFCRALRARLPEVAPKSRESEQREMATEDMPNERPTRRELEVLRLVASGLSNRQIGDALGLTENTVKWNLQQLYQKFGVHKRLQAIEHARRLGLLTEA
ncbi:MAG: LuxR C-terminal-related transcriptional regulator [Alphaproteobacteria bacterium]